MDYAALRAHVLAVNANVHGVAVTVTPPDADAISTTGLWAQPLDEALPVGRDFQRREPRRVLCLKVADVGTVPRGSVIVAAEHGGAARSWRAEGIERQDAEQVRVIVTALA